MTSSYATVVNPRDFNSDTTDPQRDVWNAGAMRHLVKALGCAPVTVVLEKSTGFTMTDVRLTNVRQTPGYGTFQVLVVSTLSGGRDHRCWYTLNDVGTVVIPDGVGGGLGARYIAQQSLRDERSTVMRLARPEWEATLEGPASRGKWEVRSFSHHVTVSFRPEKLLVGKFWYKLYRLSELDD